MTIESDGVITEVSREYEPTTAEVRGSANDLLAVHETPGLASVAKAVAAAAAATHRPTHEGA